MIKASELRIGNYYQASIEFNGSIEAKFNLFGAERIFILTEDKLILLLQLRKELLEWVNPIPLTEEWLLKFGFESKRYSMFLSVYENKITIQNDFSYVSGGFKVYIKYAHQLQDLFFALTGNEIYRYS